MNLPVTHFLYVGVLLSMFGVVALLLSSCKGRRVLALHSLFGGIALVSVAFSRYWGSNEGQAMALLIMVMATASVATRSSESVDGGGR